MSKQLLLSYEECYSLVFKAAEYDSFLEDLKNKYYENKINTYEIKRIVNTETYQTDVLNGFVPTPLMVAVWHGSITCIKFFVEECETKVDLDFYDNYDTGGMKNPLLCAIYRKFYHIVDYLVDMGARIEHLLILNEYNVLRMPHLLTNLFFMGNIKIVRTFLECKLNVEMKDENGYTCLIKACRSHHFHITEYLLERKIDLKDGYTALFYCTALYYCFISFQRSKFFKVIQLILSHHPATFLDNIYSDGLSVEEKINNWELKGCNLIDDGNDVINAQKYWLTASNERKKLGDGKSQQPSSREIASYGNYDEQTIIVNFEDDNVFIKALIIREKILGIILTINVILRRGNWYLRQGNNIYGIKLLLHYINIIHNCYVNHNYILDGESIVMIIDDDYYYDHYFDDNGDYLVSEISTVFENNIQNFLNLNFCDTMTILEKMFMRDIEISLDYYKYKLDNNFISDWTYDDKMNKYIKIVLKFIELNLDKVKQQQQQQHNDFDIVRFTHFIRNFIALDLKKIDGITILHLALVTLETYNRIDIIQLLLDAGADPNAKDKYGDTPLHYFARFIYKYKYIHLKNVNEIVLLCLVRGAHLDAVNNYGETFSSIQKIISFKTDLDYVSLQCLAARVVRERHDIYNEIFIPPRIWNFINKH